MKFVFKALGELDRGSLSQGDVIRRSEALSEAIREAHEYYATAQDYTHFVILTQSCDLVRRGQDIKAPYVTIAAARPLSVVVEKFVSSHIEDVHGTVLAKTSARRRLEEKLERIIHNTEDGLFFLPKDGCDALNEDLCVFLHLSIALRTSHYNTLLENKIAEIDDVFRAKLGWLAGNIYSRVATPDIEEYVSDSKSYKRAFFEANTPTDDVLWLSSLQSTVFKTKAKELAKDMGVAELPEDTANDLISGVPQDLDIVADAIVQRLLKNDLISGDEDTMRKTKNSIKNTPDFKSAVKKAFR
ncbi:MAG: hypothetical protein ACQEUZ_09920 [Pseudomonadota bacterium]